MGTSSSINDVLNARLKRTQVMKKKCPAVVHVDGTARPQIVDARDGVYAAILEAYCAATGLPAIVNTSFNAHGEPIVCSAMDAWKGFAENDCCDVLAIYPYLLTKPEPNRKRGLSA